MSMPSTHFFISDKYATAFFGMLETCIKYQDDKDKRKVLHQLALEMQLPLPKYAQFSSYASDMSSPDEGLWMMMVLAIKLYAIEGQEAMMKKNTFHEVKDISLLLNDSPIVFIGHLLFVNLLISLFHHQATSKRPLSSLKRRLAVDQAVNEWLYLLDHQIEQKYLNYFVRLSPKIGDRNRNEKTSDYFGKLTVEHLHHRHNIIDTVELVVYHLIHKEVKLTSLSFSDDTFAALHFLETLLEMEEPLIDHLLRVDNEAISQLKKHRYQTLLNQPPRDDSATREWLDYEIKRLDLTKAEIKQIKAQKNPIFPII